MDWTVYLPYVPLMLLLVTGMKVYGHGKWNEEWLSLNQAKMLQGYMAVLIMFHHMAQKTCAPWHAQRFIVHGLDPFVPIGYFFVGIFLFFSGFGLYKSVKTKPDYLKGFPRRRILPVIAAFYLSEWLFLAVRLFMGEKMDWKQFLWFFTGAQLANPNAWYVIALPFFYLFFYVSFRFCKKHGWALAVTSICILGYITLGTFIDHNDWWMRGEWWYNTAHFFVIGMLFARFEQPLKRIAQRRWWLWMSLAVICSFVFFYLSEHTLDVLSYYGENWRAPDKVLRRWGCLGTQILASTSFVATVLLLSMKIRIGNRCLAWLGSVTMEFYLIHGLFVDLFGYDFLEVRPSLVYIRSVPLYVLAVVVCTVPGTILFKLALKPVNQLISVRYQHASHTSRRTHRQLSDLLHHQFTSISVFVRKNAAKIKRYFTLFIFVVIVAAAGTWIAIKVILPEVRYRSAIQFREKGQYEEAVSSFIELGDFRDAEEQIAETYYQQATHFVAANDIKGAAAVFQLIKGYKDVDSLIENDSELSAAVNAVAERSEAFSVGHIVSFGSYPQSIAETENTSIEWIVLESDRQRALLISRYALDCQSYNTSYADVAWESCSLREWLNDSFLNKAFTPEEQAGIILSLIDNSSEQGFFETDGGPETYDKFFLLSYAEAWHLFQSDADRLCISTDYAAENQRHITEEGYCQWWLRSPAWALSSACSINEQGARGGAFVHDAHKAVRPAIWIDLSAECF